MSDLSHIQTPETDAALCRYEHPAWPEGREFTVNGKSVVQADIASDIERRLTVCRDLLACINSSQIMDGQIHAKISETLTQTAPKP